jgi:hypothetical protein
MDAAKPTSDSPEPIACPICHRPLRRTSGHLLSALECEQCGPFSDFTGSSMRTRAVGSNQPLKVPGRDSDS